MGLNFDSPAGSRISSSCSSGRPSTLALVCIHLLVLSATSSLTFLPFVRGAPSFLQSAAKQEVARAPPLSLVELSNDEVMSGEITSFLTPPPRPPTTYAYEGDQYKCEIAMRESLRNTSTATRRNFQPTGKEIAGWIRDGLLTKKDWDIAVEVANSNSGRKQAGENEGTGGGSESRPRARGNLIPAAYVRSFAQGGNAEVLREALGKRWIEFFEAACGARDPRERQPIFIPRTCPAELVAACVRAHCPDLSWETIEAEPTWLTPEVVAETIYQYRTPVPRRMTRSRWMRLPAAVRHAPRVVLSMITQANFRLPKNCTAGRWFGDDGKLSYNDMVDPVGPQHYRVQPEQVVDFDWDDNDVIPEALKRDVEVVTKAVCHALLTPAQFRALPNDVRHAKTVVKCSVLRGYLSGPNCWDNYDDIPQELRSSTDIVVAAMGRGLLRTYEQWTQLPASVKRAPAGAENGEWDIGPRMRGWRALPSAIRDEIENEIRQVALRPGMQGWRDLPEERRNEILQYLKQSHSRWGPA
ncbi:unnamed protein product [Amoebophrya sp. A25]|nr:unnamed protein product [Amoebophrya sp. A25]|eukprot:GSA25T00014765001.1